jgi:hypothetical protein
MGLRQMLGLSLALMMATAGCSPVTTSRPRTVELPPQPTQSLPGDFLLLQGFIHSEGEKNAPNSGLRKDKDGEYRAYEVNGREIRHLPNQLVVDLNDESKIGLLLQKYNATIIEEHRSTDIPVVTSRSVPTPDPSDPGKDFSYPNNTVRPDATLPTWWVISVPAYKGDTYLDFEQNGPKIGLQGTYKISDWETAVLLAKMARIRLDPELGVSNCYPNYLGSVDSGSTKE